MDLFLILVWKSNPSAGALCCYNTINHVVLVCFQFIAEKVMCLTSSGHFLKAFLHVFGTLGIDFVVWEGPGNRLDF